MKMEDAMKVMERPLPKLREGFLVHFEFWDSPAHVVAGTDYFPAPDEPAIKDLDEASSYAFDFAMKGRGEYINVYVVNASDSTPVKQFGQMMVYNKY